MGGQSREARQILDQAQRAAQSGLSGSFLDVQNYPPVKYTPFRWTMRAQIHKAPAGIFFKPLYKMNSNGAACPIRQLRPDHLQTLYSRKLENGLSKHTVQFIHSVIHKALGQALKWGLIPRNVASLVEAPRPSKRPPAVMTPQEVNVFLNSVRDHRYSLIFQLALYCGFREGEVLGIHVEDCDLQKGNIKVLHTVQTLKGGLVIAEPKTKSSRRAVTVPATALVALRNHISRLNRHQGLIFTTSTGRPISPSNVVKEFKAALEKAGLPKIRFHDLRHTSATLLLSAGVHPKVVQERLGHSQISMTMDLYTHVLPTLQEEAAVKMEEILSHP